MSSSVMCSCSTLTATALRPFPESSAIIFWTSASSATDRSLHPAQKTRMTALSFLYASRETSLPEASFSRKPGASIPPRPLHVPERGGRLRPRVAHGGEQEQRGEQPRRPPPSRHLRPPLSDLAAA